MYLSRLRIGEITALVGAIVLVLSLFLDWVVPNDKASPPLSTGGNTVYSYDLSAMSGFSSAGILVVLLLLAVAALALTLVFLTVTLEPVGLTLSAAVGTAFFGILVTLVTVVRLTLVQPDGGLGDAAVDLALGAYLSLLGVALCALGGWLTLRDERTKAPYSAAPELEPRPAPPAEAGTDAPPATP